jgi:hypothetical protein
MSSLLGRYVLGASIIFSVACAGAGCAAVQSSSPPTRDPVSESASIAPSQYPEYQDETAPRAGSALPKQDASPDAEGSSSDPVVRYQGADTYEDEDSGLWDVSKLTDLTPGKVYDNLRDKTPWRRNEIKARDLFHEGETLFREAKYPEAADKFKSAAFYWPDSPMEEDALFMLGECQFFSDQYPKANDTYAGLLKKYVNSRHIDKIVNRQFAIAKYWQDLQRAKPKAFLSPNVNDRTRPFFDTSGTKPSA